MRNPMHGVLLLNLGTPDDCDVRSVRRYLREFLNDPRVIDLPWLLRKILVNVCILPFRPKQSAHAYQSIWATTGSPLLTHSLNLCEKVSTLLPSDVKVVLGMRYGNPSISQALAALQSCEQITLLPLFPQYSSAATGSAIEKALTCINTWQNYPHLNVIRDFHAQPSFIQAQAAQIKAHLPQAFDMLLFSYHGLPERHLLKGGCQALCQPNCLNNTSNPASCYRKQCYLTSQSLQQTLKLNPNRTTTSFQSRLGKTPWIAPYTDELITQLYQQGVRRLVVACPSFVSDCLETLEEIGMQAKAQWEELGGSEFTLIPCLNDMDQWSKAVVTIVQNASAVPAPTIGLSPSGHDGLSEAETTA